MWSAKGSRGPMKYGVVTPLRTSEPRLVGRDGKCLSLEALNSYGNFATPDYQNRPGGGVCGEV